MCQKCENNIRNNNEHEKIIIERQDIQIANTNEIVVHWNSKALKILVYKIGNIQSWLTTILQMNKNVNIYLMIQG